ncbi:hypothetical protein [Pseudomonas sp.]|uniref:hypothetical protein n=1 Tax=Pseudomonas sp. TaxID=306 RepID=UPI003CC5626E
MNIERASGDLDPEFGSQGVARLPSAGGSDYATCIALIAGGGLYVGYHCAGRYRLARLTADGQLDPTFGENGYIDDSFYIDKEPPNSQSSTVFGIIVQDGYVMVVGELYYSFSITEAYYYPAMARFTLAGALDRTFADGGHKVCKAEVDSRFVYQAANVAGGYDTRLKRLYVIVNGSVPWGSENFKASAVLAFNMEGGLDGDFGEAGIAVVKPVAFSVFSWSSHIDDTGIYLGSRLEVEPSEFIDCAVLKLTHQGTFDEGFGVQGIQLLERNAYPLGMFAGDHQNVMVVGYGGGSGVQFSLGQMDGLNDATFNGGQPLEVSYQGTSVYGRVGLSKEGRYWVGNRWGVESQALVERYHANGTLDAGFGVQGRALIEPRDMRDCMAGATIASDDKGRLLLAGFDEFIAPVVVRLLG